MTIVSFILLVWLQMHQIQCFQMLKFPRVAKKNEQEYSPHPISTPLGYSSVRETIPGSKSSSLHSQNVEELETDSSVTYDIVVVGGGWAGFEASDVLSNADNVNVHLLDASPRGPGGLAGGWRTEKGNYPVEAGLHGFWREYRNTFSTIERIGLDVDEILTPYTPSILVSQSGVVALAPVLGSQGTGDADSKQFNPDNVDWLKPSSILSAVAEFLPPPLDIAFLADFNDNSRLTAFDRLSALGLLGVWSDFLQEDPESWKRYDKLSAENLFRSVAGVSPNLYRELVSPLLHVLPMTPGYDCSAAAALSCFHVFALQARGAFDVRWARGTISEKIFNPWTERLVSTGNVKIQGNAKVTAIEEIKHEDRIQYSVQINGEESMKCDAVVLAVGGTAMKNLLRSSPPLAKLEGANGWKQFRGVSCVAVRLFLKPSVTKEGKISGISSLDQAMKDSPVAVCGPNIGNLPELVETGFCIYDLQRLHDEFNLEKQNEDKNFAPCLAYEVDFFRASELAKLEDNMEVARVALSAISAALNIAPIDHSLIQDVSVVRAKDAVSHFCVNSASWSPQVKLSKQMYICGDWIDRTGHASWSTEKAVVTGRQAAGALAKDFGLTCNYEVLPAAADTPQLSALRQVAGRFRQALPSDVLPGAPWVLAQQVFRGRV